nr:MAG TPA: hypothetical protein [Caudoviricetes sp.]
MQGILNECTIFVPEIHENYAFNAKKPSTRISEQRAFCYRIYRLSPG